MRHFLKLARKPDWENLPDEALAAHFRRTGAEEAANELFRRYAHLVYGACRRFLPEAANEDWRDATMVAFERLYAQLRQSEVTSSFNGLLYAITRNVCISQARKATNWGASEEKWEILEKSVPEFMENDHFERLYHKAPGEKAAELLEVAIAQLDEAQRTCIRLFYYERKSYQEIAAEAGYDLKQVKSALQNGKRSLRLSLTRALKEIET